MRRTLLPSFALFVLLGLPEGVLGTVWPTVRDEFGRPQSGLAILIAGTTVGYTLASAASGHLSERFGPGSFLTGSAIVSACGLALVVAAPSFWTLVGALAVLGLGSGSIDAGLNAWTALTRGPRAMGLLHAGFGFGATLGPLLAAGFITADQSWRGPYVVVMAGQLLMIITFSRTAGSFDRAPTHPIVEAPDGSPRAEPPRALQPVVLVWFVVYVGAEVAVGSWAFTHLTEHRGWSEGAAGSMVGSYWAAIMIGRLALGVLGHRAVPERVMAASNVLALVGGALWWLDPGGGGAVGIPLTGLAFATMFPLLVNRTPAYLGPERSNRAIGYQVAAASLGGITIPAVIGVLADRRGIEVAPPIVLMTIGLLAFIWLSITRMTRGAEFSI